MIIDLSKLMFNQVDKINIKDSINIPKEYLNNTDIRDISNVHVEGIIYGDSLSINLDINVKCNLTLICSVTLKDVDYPVDININEIIDTNDENNENFIKIINNTIDLLPIIWQNILVEVPIRVVSKDLKEENIYGDGWKFITKEEENKEIDPRLEKLKDFLGE